MTVYFVYRSQYHTPRLNYVKTFEEQTLLEWFQTHWKPLADHGEAANYAARMLGCDVYAFGGFFQNLAKEQISIPTTEEELIDTLQECLDVDGELSVKANVVQVVDNDDELEFAYYLFDDVFLKEYGARACFLLREAWELPVDHAEAPFIPTVPVRNIAPKGNGEGTTYCAFFAAYDEGGQITNVQGPWQIEGVRIPDLAHYLARHEPGKDLDLNGSFPCELFILRSQLFLPSDGTQEPERQSLEALGAHPEETSRWDAYFAVMSDAGIQNPGQRLLEHALKQSTRLPVAELSWGIDWKGIEGKSLGLSKEQIQVLSSQPRPFGYAFDPSKSLIQVSEHLLQASIHTDRWESWGNRDLYNRWIIFDDRWAGSNPDLANCILRYQARWDVLSD